MQSFEKLEVWQKSLQFTINVYSVTSNFPVDERYGIVSQLRRASVSICSNIAEGTGRFSPKDKARFITISFSSLVEVMNLLILSENLNYISNQTNTELQKQLNVISKMLSGLRKSLIKHPTLNIKL